MIENRPMGNAVGAINRVFSVSRDEDESRSHKGWRMAARRLGRALLRQERRYWRAGWVAGLGE